jgi:hypothetical protein
MGYNVNVNRIFTPTINSTPILSCSSDNVQITASNYGVANSFTWSISGGTIVSGQGSSIVTVSPDPLQGGLTANCTVRRTAASASYTRSNTKTFTKVARTATFSNPVTQDFICKGSGLIFQVDNQNGMSGVTWNAPNCIISPETIVNGKRQVTITPNNTVTIGSSITINSIANYTGGCTAVTPSKSYAIYEGGTPPMPIGYVETMPYYEDGDFCDPPYRGKVVFFPNQYPVDFGIPGPIDPNYAFVNSITTVSIRYIAVKTIDSNTPYIPRTFDVIVCNVNPCNGVKTCRTFQTNAPVCTIGGDPYLSNKNTMSIIMSPNPTKGNFTINLPEKLSGEFHISDQYGLQLQEGKFKEASEINIQLQDKLKSGIYIVNVVAGERKFTSKIILNRS